MNQAGKSVLITGAASGIGAATAKLFGQYGWQVGAADIDGAGLGRLADAMPDGLCLPLPLDVTQRRDWDRALARFAEMSGGRLDLLVNNAGVFAMGPFAEMDEAAIRRTIDINLMGVIHGVRAAHALLKATDGAGIVNVASFLALSGAGRGSVYSATKAAVHNLTEGLAAELRYDGIWVSDVLPGFVATGFFEGDEDRDARAESFRAAGIKFLPPEAVAARIWSATRRYKLHRVVGRQAKLLAAVRRLSPAWAHSAMRSVSKRLMKSGH